MGVALWLLVDFIKNILGDRNMSKRGKILMIVLVLIGIGGFGRAIYPLFSRPEKSAETQIKDINDLHHNPIARTNLRVARNDLKGFSSLCESTKHRLEVLKKEIQDSGEPNSKELVSEIKQQLKKVNKQSTKIKAIIKELEKLLKEVEDNPQIDYQAWDGSK